MVLDSRILKVKQALQIFQPEEWCKWRPQDILAIPDIGPVTLDHIRLYLAGRDLCLQGDMTPAYWRKHFHDAKIGHVMGEQDLAITAPFTVLIDTKEQHPFAFECITADANRNYAPMIVPTRFLSLGDGWADYSIDGWQGHVHIERKSIHDAHGTILGWGERRERFEHELKNLASIECAAVVVECSLGELIAEAPEHGKKSKRENAKILHRSVMSWSQEYRVPWHFCDNRQLAEITTYRILQRFWEKANDEFKTAVKRKRTKPAEKKETMDVGREALASLF